MAKLMLLFSGWKRIAAWVLLQVPGLSDYPGVLGSLQALLASPSKENIINACLQVLMAVGVAHGVLKQIKNV